MALNFGVAFCPTTKLTGTEQKRATVIQVIKIFFMGYFD
jgi:hypothetical protein